MIWSGVAPHEGEAAAGEQWHLRRELIEGVPPRLAFGEQLTEVHLGLDAAGGIGGTRSGHADQGAVTDSRAAAGVAGHPARELHPDTKGCETTKPATKRAGKLCTTPDRARQAEAAPDARRADEAML